MGGTPQIPQWLPEGWNTIRYSVDLTDSFSALEIKYGNSKRSDEWISYTNYVYFSIDNIYIMLSKKMKTKQKFFSIMEKQFTYLAI